MTFVNLLGGSTTTNATLACNADRTSCTWSAPSPPLGLYTMTVRGTDRTDHVTSVGVTLYVSLKL